MSILRHSAWAAAAALVLTGSRFVFAAIIARRLSLAGFGQYAYGQWLVDITFLVCSLGATGVIGRYIAEFRHDSALTAAFIRYWRPFAIGLPLLAAVIIPVGVWLSGLKLEWSTIAWLALWTFANGLWAMQSAALSGLQRFDLIFFANTLAATILVGGALLLPINGQSLDYVFGLMSIASACAAVMGLSVTLRLANAPATPLESGRWRAMRGYAINIWLTALLWSLVWSRGEMPIVRAYLGDDGLAHYAAALTLFGGAVQGVMLATSGVAPQLTRLWGEGSQLQALALARKLMDTQLLLCGFAALLLIYFSPELMQIAFGASYQKESGSLAVLSLGLIALALSCQNHLLQIATDARFSRNSTLFGLVVLMGLALALISNFGLLGAAMARAGTMLTMGAVSLVAVQWRWGSTAYSKANAAGVFIIAAVGVLMQLWLVDLTWILRSGIALLAFVLLIVLVRDAEGRMQARVVLERVRQAFWPISVVEVKRNKL